MEEQAFGVIVSQSLHIMRVLVLSCICRSDGNEERPDAAFSLFSLSAIFRISLLDLVVSL